MKFFPHTIIKILILSCTLNFSIVINVHAKDTIEAKDTLDTITGILTNLTCETQGVGNLLRSEFSHTCIPAPFFTFAVMNLVSPVFYMNTFLRLKINDHELFDKEFPGGQCTRNNRADPDNLELTFALCSNAKLALVRTKAVAESAVAIAKAVLTGDDPWEDIKDSWKNNEADYHNIYTAKPGDSGTMFDLGFPAIPWKVIQDNDRICMSTPGFSKTGYIPVGCKYIREPFPKSIYSNFMDISGDSSALSESTDPTDPLALVECSSAADGGCYQRAYNNSKTAVVITAPLIECIKEMTARLLISRDVCSFDDINQVITDPSKRNSSALFQFQVNMHKIVTALLTLYVIFFGFKIILAGEVPPKAEFINFILKMLFVTYFSIGINITPGNTSNYDRLDGMIQFVFPFLLNGISGLASWVMNASPSDLCKFNGSDIQYDSKIAYIALWDALDCRVAHYLGLDMLSTLYVENAYKVHDFKNFDFFSFSAPPYIYLLIPAIISGNMMLVSIALSYPLLVISVAAFMVNATVMCMISIVILGILAPLFVPMLLFQYTRGYFDQWVKLLISFLLQPMVVTTFMITMFSVYDFGFYGKCKYTNKLIHNSIENVYQSGGKTSRDVLIFYIDNDWNKYTKEEADSCKSSLGYMLNNPLSTMFDFAKDSLDEIITEKPGATETDKYLAKFQFLSGIILGPGMFFISPKVLFEKIKDILLALITACFTLYLMYNFSSQLAEFAADMTEGVALSNVAIKPQAIFKAAMAGLAMAGQATKALDNVAKGGGKPGDLKSSSGGKSRDNLATSGGASRDLNSSGGGKASSGSISSSGGTAPTPVSTSGNRVSTSNGGRVPSPTQEKPETISSDSLTNMRASIATPSSLKSPDIASSPTSLDSSKEEKKDPIKDDTDKLPGSSKQEKRIKNINEADTFEDLSGQLNIERKTASIKEDKQDNVSTKKKAYGLADDKDLNEQESHEKKQGETGFIKQEKRNAEIRERKAASEKEREELLRSGGGRAGPNSKKMDRGTDEN
ncbi:MAG: type IV secretion system protein [Rickettsia endosymbiont of Oxypoda opaca]|nr:type IV secretion system protein [Rickettsia endosymbiont of Oxypoda opaca]